MHLLFVTENLESNSLGRTYCLWLLAQSAGWKTTVVSQVGKSVWEPLEGTEFAEHCHAVPSVIEAVPDDVDLVIACKPLASSLGLALKLTQMHRLPMIVDVDDPDIESRLRSGRPLAAIARAARHPLRTARDLRYRRIARALPTFVSNPWLLARYGGTLIPHVRRATPEPTERATGALTVAFIGTPHKHKGIDVLRTAVRDAQPSNDVKLIITGEAPEDASPWESWVGRTSMQEGLALLESADIVMLPSLQSANAAGQLPAKLIDAMLAAKAIAVSDIEPMPWAIGRGGIVVNPGSSHDLGEALIRFSSASLRQECGRLSRERALSHFTVEANLRKFIDACESVVKG